MCVCVVEGVGQRDLSLKGDPYNHWFSVTKHSSVSLVRFDPRNFSWVQWSVTLKEEIFILVGVVIDLYPTLLIKDKV